jgi:hypothetical protein
MEPENIQEKHYEYKVDTSYISDNEIREWRKKR